MLPRAEHEKWNFKITRNPDTKELGWVVEIFSDGLPFGVVRADKRIWALQAAFESVVRVEANLEKAKEDGST